MRKKYRLQRWSWLGCGWITLADSDDLDEVKRWAEGCIIQQPYRIVDAEGKRHLYVGKEIEEWRYL